MKRDQTFRHGSGRRPHSRRRESRLHRRLEADRPWSWMRAWVDLRDALLPVAHRLDELPEVDG